MGRHAKGPPEGECPDCMHEVHDEGECYHCGIFADKYPSGNPCSAGLSLYGEEFNG